MRFWFQGAGRGNINCLHFKKKKKKFWPWTITTRLRRYMWEKCESWASYLRRGGGQWVGGDFTLRSQSFFCFYQQDSSHPQPDFCLFFFVLAAPFCDNKGFTPSCCRSATSRLVSLWRGGVDSLGFLTQLLSFCSEPLASYYTVCRQ